MSSLERDRQSCDVLRSCPPGGTLLFYKYGDRAVYRIVLLSKDHVDAGHSIVHARFLDKPRVHATELCTCDGYFTFTPAEKLIQEYMEEDSSDDRR